MSGSGRSLNPLKRLGENLLRPTSCLEVAQSLLQAVLNILAQLALLAEVDPLFRGPVALFYLEDYTYNEIAAVLEIPLGTVKSRIARGLSELKNLVAQLPEFRGKENFR